MNYFPFPSAYWVVPGKLLAGGFPGSSDPTAKKMKLGGLIKTGTKLVVNLMEAEERNYQNQLFDNYSEVLNESEIETIRFPIEDMSVPTVQQMTEILDCIDSAHEQGKIVYVHCWGGVGRTGTVVGCYLIRHQIADKNSVFDTIEFLKRNSSIADRISPETDRQRKFVINW